MVVRRRRWRCSGAPMGPLSAQPVVPPHCAGSSSVASLPCGHTGRKRKEGQMEKGRKKGWMEKGGTDLSWFPSPPPPSPHSPLPSPVWQNKVLSGLLHPHIVIMEVCLIYLKLSAVILRSGVPEWLQRGRTCSPVIFFFFFSQSQPLSYYGMM